MRASIRKHLSTILVAMVTAAVTASAPAVAHGVRHALFAHEADKVDGKSAVGSGASRNQRKGKLVATNPKTGRLPNNIFARALNSALLDGLDSTQFIRDGHAAGGDLTGNYPNPAIAPPPWVAMSSTATASLSRRSPKTLSVDPKSQTGPSAQTS